MHHTLRISLRVVGDLPLLLRRQAVNQKANGVLANDGVSHTEADVVHLVAEEFVLSFCARAAVLGGHGADYCFCWCTYYSPVDGGVF